MTDEERLLSVYESFNDLEDKVIGMHAQGTRRLESSSCTNSWNRGLLWHAIIIVVELILLLALSTPLLARKSLCHGSQSDIAGLRKLTIFSKIVKFENNTDWLRGTDEADRYWRDLLATGGVVSLDTQWALDSGLSPSFPSPTNPRESIYQVDVFHALHCLNALRQNLMSDDGPAWNAVHIEHCLDYIRHQLICHPDLTLIPTRDLDEFVLDEPHQCQNYDGVVEWVHQHRWKEFDEYYQNKSTSARHLEIR